MQDNEQKKKRKSGLHKEISSIFEGISVPGAVERPSGAARKRRSARRGHSGDARVAGAPASDG